ncbi:MAG TPA: dihydrolipoyl dehydrogenase [Dehalococcoidales bacterium]|nr:dihydrolipoyl dehydrogenase [Dehalococcoidales bacterium]
MKQYDVIVIGSGCGMNIVEEALAHELKVALVDKGPLGGTCPNNGCIPSKILIYTADRIVDIQEDVKFGIRAELKSVDFSAVMDRMRENLRANREQMRKSITAVEQLDFYESEGRFTDEYTVEVGGEQIKAEKIFIAAGSRPSVPPIKGLDSVPYLTNVTVLDFTERPESLLIIGGGYIAVEYGHFFAAMGTRVTIIEMADRLVLPEEPEISALLKSELSKRMSVNTGVRAVEVKKTAGGVTVVVNDLNSGAKKEFTGQKLLVAVGRVSNADSLNLEKTGVGIDRRKFIEVNEFLETSRKNIYAVGDILGRMMFTHVANMESSIAGHNGIHGNSVKMDYNAAPYAVYSHPQIASVGVTEAAARAAGRKILVGRAKYADVAQGEAMLEKDNFAKAIVDAKTEKIIGFHIIGPFAPLIIQEVITNMVSGGKLGHIEQAMHIHPAIPELILKTLSNLEETT